MIAPIGKVQGEGNCGRVTDRGEEACECVRKYRPDIAVGRILTSAARLRTETSYKAGVARQVSTTSRSRSQTAAQVNDELVQRQITTTGSLSRPGRTAAASIEKPALSLFPEFLMEAVVDPANLRRAWRQVRANRGAPGPDGITLSQFPE